MGMEGGALCWPIQVLTGMVHLKLLRLISVDLLCSGTSILLTTYRDKDDALNFIAAGGKNLCYKVMHYLTKLSCLHVRCNWRTL